MNERSWNIKGLEKVVLMAEKGCQNVFQPPQARVMGHVLWNIAVIGAHKRDFFLSSILNEMQARTVGNCDVNQRGFKIGYLLLDLLAESKSELVGSLGVIGIVKKWDRDTVVEKDN